MRKKVTYVKGIVTAFHSKLSVLPIFTLLIILTLIPYGTNAQTVDINPGCPANFGIDGDIYSGEFSGIDPLTANCGFPTSSTDDWLSGVSGGVAVIDEDSDSIPDGQVLTNTSFCVGLQQGLDESIYIDGFYARDHFAQDQTAFSSGGSSKNQYNPENWVAGPGSVLSKNDIIDAFSALKRDTDDHLWFIGGLSLLSSNGTHHADFELFREEVGATSLAWISDGTNYGRTAWEFTIVGSDVSVTQIGDILFSFDFEKGGDNLVDVTQNITLWMTEATYEALLAVGSFQLSTAAGTVTIIVTTDFAFEVDGANPDKFGYARIEIDASVRDDVIFTAENTVDAPGPPWGTFIKQSGNDNSSLTYETNHFSEIAVDLTALGLESGNGDDCATNPNGGGFSTLVIKSRSAASFTAALKDYVKPTDFGQRLRIDIACEVTENIDCTDPNGEICITGVDPALVNDGTYTIEWFSGNTIVGSGLCLEVTDGDDYFAVVSVTATGCALDTSATCSANVDTTSLGLNFSPNDITCFGFNDGSIDLTITGGTPVSISWTGPDLFASADEDISGLAVGEYCVEVLASNGCISMGCVTIEEPPQLFILDGLNPSGFNCCPDGTSGIVCLTPRGGTPPYTITVEDEDGVVDVLNNVPEAEICIGGLSANTQYTFTVVDANDCEVDDEINVGVQFPEPIIEVSTCCIDFNICCNGGSTGFINLTVGSCDGENIYAWTGPDGFVASTNNISGLAAGMYCVTVMDDCTIVLDTCITLTEPDPLVVSGTKSLYPCDWNTSCPDAEDGSIDLDVTGGCPPYTYSWTGPGFISALEDISGLGVGEYCVDVEDASGCVTNMCFTLINDDQPPTPPTPPGDVTVQCADDVPDPVDLTATDDCDGDLTESPVDQITPGDCPNNFTVLRTWTFTDMCDHTVSVSQNITVNDDTGPVLDDPPADVTVQCLEDIPAMTSLGYTDNCDDPGTVSGSDGPLTGGECPGTITRTWDVSDACGNPAITRTQVITVNDDIDPVLDAAPADVTVQCIEDIPANISLGWTDNCSGPGTVPGSDGPLVGGACGGTITRSWDVSDECGNPAVTRTQTITVDDTTPPMLDAAPADVTVECIDDVPANTSLGYTDNCDDPGTVPGSDGPLVGGACGGTITRSWNVSDACGNPALTRTQTITVDDNTPPVLDAAPADVTVECIEDVPANTSLGYTDNCDDPGTVPGSDGPLVGGECGGTITRSWNVSDACGNPAVTRTQTITVDDNTPPVLDAAPADVTVQCVEDVPAITSLGYTDNCDDPGTVPGSEGPLVGGECGGMITRVWNVSDACGNPALTRTQTITVDDTTPPVLDAAPADVTVECIDDVPANTSLGYTDNCDDPGTVPGSDGPLVGGECGGTITRSWNVSDDCGNPAVPRTQTITVDDTTPPVLDAAPADVTVQCMEDIPAMTSLGYTDNCDNPGTVPGSDGPLTGGECPGTVTRTWNVSDACGNPAITRTQVITVNDDVNPVLDAAPADVTVQCIEDIPANTSLGWTDNCSGPGTVPGSDGPLVGGACGGTITRSWDVSDACGNPAVTRTQTITVDDTTPPVLDAAPADVTVECIDDVPANTSLGYTDNCDDPGTVPGSDGPLVGGECGGTITRSWNVSDACGNPALTRTQTITVDDTTPPVLDAAPADVTVECIDDVPANTSLGYTDNCDDPGTVPGSDGPLVGGECGGTITRSWNVSDACGNPALTRTQTITVDDTTPPVLDAAPADVTVQCVEDVPAITSLGYTDNCDDPGTVPGSEGPLVGGECGGMITRVWNVSDACGNPAVTRTQTITVDDTTPPVLDAAPADVTVECIDDVPANTSLGYTDNCDEPGTVPGSDGPLVGGECGGTITRSWNVSDDCGNPAVTRTQTITVDDTTPPVLDAAPADVTVQCIEDVPAMTSLGYTDNCDDPGTVPGSEGSLVGGECGGTITRVWNVSDACGNPALTRTQTITVDDTTPPVLDAAPADVTVQCIEDVPTMTSLGYTDNCDDPGTAPGSEGPLVGGECGGTITRVWNVSDACGNPALTRTQTITVDDTTPPVLDAAPADVTVQCIEDVPAITSLGYTDNCDDPGTVPGSEGPLVGGECGGMITRVWNVSDACGNPALTRTQTITVDDTTPPVLDAAPADVTVECIDDVPANTSLGYTDNCDDPGTVPGSDGPLVGGECGGTITRSWNVSDDCGNPAVTRTQTITVDDTTPPVPPSPPADLSVECNDDVPPPGDLIAEDNCDGLITVTGVDEDNGGAGCDGDPLIITRTWTFVDDCDNPSSISQTITVEPDPLVCVIDAPEDVILCGSLDNTLSVESVSGGCPDYDYSWSVESDESSWTITGGANSPNITYTAGVCGDSATFTVQITDENGCQTSCSIKLGCGAVQFCTFTQGFYGNAGGRDCAHNTTLEILNDILGQGNLVLGDPAEGNAITFFPTDAECVIKRLPGGGPARALDGIATCENPVGVALHRSGRMHNILLAQTLTLALNLRYDSNLSDLVMGDRFMITAESTGCVDAEEVACPEIIPGTNQVYEVPDQFIGWTVGEILDYANDALAGLIPQNQFGAIVDAASNINEGFDECRILIEFTDLIFLESIDLGGDQRIPVQMEAHPNPVSDMVHIEFMSPESGKAVLQVINQSGIVINELYNGQTERLVPNVVRYSTSELLDGIYYYRLIIGNDVVTKKLIIMHK